MMFMHGRVVGQKHTMLRGRFPLLLRRPPRLAGVEGASGCKTLGKLAIFDMVARRRGGEPEHRRRARDVEGS